MENKKSTIWTTVFWIVTALSILQYLFMALPRISQTPNATGAYYFGSLVPNAIIIIIFWFIKRSSEKSKNQ